MSDRIAPRWRTRFGSWVKGYGVASVARDIGVSLYGSPISTAAIYQWVAGARMPRPAHAKHVVALSAGKVRLEDIYAQRAALGAKTAREDRATRPNAGVRGSEDGRKP